VKGFAPTSTTELLDLLRSRPGRLRLTGQGTRQARLPDAGSAAALRLDGLATIDRLDGPDQTCSVDCGVTRAQLDAALLPLGLELPCPGEGTLGGLFAADALGAAAEGGGCPRSLLLGLEGALADGTPFRSGARVVKSVAGFDVHKLFVGSRGRLFVATRLHLRLRPRPRAAFVFANGGLDAGEAVALLRRLRALPLPLAALQLHRQADGAHVVAGRLVGRDAYVRTHARALGLCESDAPLVLHLPAPGWPAEDGPVGGHGEVLAGNVLPSTLPALLAATAGHALCWHGGGRFELASPDAAHSERWLEWLHRHHVRAAVVAGPSTRRGHGTPLDDGERALTTALQQALDPHGILA
jgi:FAD/FMN-containing dehydrogenase